jgi:hypothetical protein
MADSGMLIGWDRSVPGRESIALELFEGMVHYLRRLHVEGQITHFEPVMLGAHGGHLNGFFLIRGDQARLDDLRNSDDFRGMVVKANMALSGFTILRAHFGGEVAELMGVYGSLA